MHRTIAVALALAAHPCAVAGPAGKPADNPRVTCAAFDKIRWLMPSKEIENILGKGESVGDYSVVLHAMGSQPGAKGAPYQWVEGGLWVKWRGKDQTIYVQFGGPSVVRNKDGSYSVGPDTQCSLILLITEKSSKTMRRGQMKVEIRDILVSWRRGPRVGQMKVEIRAVVK
jgi:hypothetical protein